MKKVGFIVILMMSTIFVSGCFFNETMITCTKNTDESGVKTEEKVVTKVKDNKVTTIDTEIKMDMTGEQPQAIDLSYNMIKQAYSTFEAKGIKPVVTKTDSAINVTVTIDFKKASTEDLTKISSSYADKKSDKIDIDTYKEEMQQEGYICK